MVVDSPLITTWTHSKKGQFLLGNYLICVASHGDMEVEQVKLMHPASNPAVCPHPLDVCKKSAVIRKNMKAFIVDNLQ